MGKYHTFLNKKSFTRYPTLVNDKEGIISNKIELQKTFKLCWPSSKTFFKHLLGLNLALHFLKFGSPYIAYQLGLIDFGRYSFFFSSFFFLIFFHLWSLFPFHLYHFSFFNSIFLILSFYPNFISSLILCHTTYNLRLKFFLIIYLCHTIYTIKVYYVP